jgi:predicted Zn-dependent protease
MNVNGDELKILLEAGVLLRELGRYDDAEIVLRGVSEIVPDSEVPDVLLGTVELQRGRFSEAQRLYEETLSRYPNSSYAQLHHAEALLFQKKRSEAVSELEAIISNDPNSPHSETARMLLSASWL